MKTIVPEVVIKNPLPQGNWICLADFLKEKHGWKKESQKLIIQLTEQYKMLQLVKLQNEIIELLRRCSDLKGIEVYYDDVLIHETLTTIPLGVIKPVVSGDAEMLSDKRHIKIASSGQSYILKKI